jgi:PPM family protein phosphatase
MNEREHAQSEAVAFSGRGAVRPHNEDSVAIDGQRLGQESVVRFPLNEDVDHLIVVADGMGGHARGELASQIAVRSIGEVWINRRPNFEPVEAARVANRAVYEAMADDPALRGMGATVVAVHVRAAKVMWFNVGDSRGYLLRDGELKQFTVDHVPMGGTGAGKGRSHSITQSIGGGYSQMEIWPAAGLLEVRKSDVFLLCTDGLTDPVSDDLIKRLLLQSRTMTEAAASLIEAAEMNGSPDNVSLVLVRL